jgi:prepilin-type processing-associated H-X9-DG protein
VKTDRWNRAEDEVLPFISQLASVFWWQDHPNWVVRGRMYLREKLLHLLVLWMFHCIRFADLVVSKAVTKRHFHPKRSLNMNFADGNVDLLLPSSLLGKQVIVIAGATSVGKSAVAAQLCKTLNAEIVIADCVQVIQS